MKRQQLMLVFLVPLLLLTMFVAGLVLLSAVATRGRMMEVHVYEPPPFPTTAPAAGTSPIPLPPEATDIRIASYSQWVAFASYLRFSAPPDVCLAHAKKILPDVELMPVEPSDVADFPPGEPFMDLSWFNPQASNNVMTTGRSASHQPQIWVDLDRGMFFYRVID